VNVVDDFFYWTNHVLAWAQFALWIWALADCATRRPAAFAAAGKLTKTGWLTILALSTLFGFLLARPFESGATPVSIIGLIATCCAGVYLADVRPALREVSGGR
jgi:hypothetical protein